MLASNVIASDDKSSLRMAIESLRVEPKNIQILIEKRKKISSYFDVSEKNSFDRAAVEIQSLLECK